MKKYQLFIDVSKGCEEDKIEVVEAVCEGNTAEEAYQALCKRIENGEYGKVIAGRNYYIWKPDESDVIED